MGQVISTAGRILITGANGFVGDGALRAARARGLEVVALYRRQPRPEWADDTGIIPMQADLSDPSCIKPLTEMMDSVTAVIHAAAHLGGDAGAHEADTVLATQHLLDALAGRSAHLVLVSSIAVYDTNRLTPGAVLDEHTPLETPETARDAYTAAKLRQETLVRGAGQSAWVLRPGAVYGPGRTWNALMGFWASKLHVQIGQSGELPLVHVDHLGQMLVQAAVTAPKTLEPLNALDDDRPTRARFLRAHRRVMGWPRLVLPVPFGLWLGFARLLRPLGHRLPGLFREPILRARLMPLRYPNTALRHALGGEDTDGFEAVLAASAKEGRP